MIASLKLLLNVTELKHKPTFYMRTIPDISSHLKYSDEVIITELIPAITREINCSCIGRKLMSLPLKVGGMGIPIFSGIPGREHNKSYQMI